MKIAMLGTGVVGNTLGGKLVSLGHEVKMGARSSNNEKAAEWVKQAGAGASQGTFAHAATFGELAFNATSGEGSLEAMQQAGAQNLEGKVLVDVSNPLDFSQGRPPKILFANEESLAERIQKALPKARVVKAFNTVSAPVMVNPAQIAGEHDLFLCGDDADAKAAVAGIARSFGWKNLVDLGPLSMARGTELYLALWVRLYGTFKTPLFNIHVAR